MKSGSVIRVLIFTAVLLLSLYIGVVGDFIKVHIKGSFIILIPPIVMTIYFVILNQLRSKVTCPILNGMGVGFLLGVLTSGNAQLEAIPQSIMLIAIWTFAGLMIGAFYVGMKKSAKNASGKDSDSDALLPPDMR